MISKELFINCCKSLDENLQLYKQVDEMMEHTYRAREYYKKAIKPVMRLFANDIAGKETLDSVIYEDDWGQDYLYDMVMRVFEDSFDNDVQTVRVRSESAAGGQCYVPFGDVYTAEVIYDWLTNMDKDDKSTWNLPIGPVASGYDVVKHYVAQGVDFETF
jgi:hypothetical protein